jgi:MFS family permease
MFVAFHLAFLQQMCGINVVIFYGSSILEDVVPGKGNLMQIFLNLCQVVGSLSTAYILTKVGRKTLLQIGTFISMIVLICLGIAYLPTFEVDGKLNHGL